MRFYTLTGLYGSLVGIIYSISSCIMNKELQELLAYPGYVGSDQALYRFIKATLFGASWGMSSFVKRAPVTVDARTNQAIPVGCKTSISGSLVTSTGINSLDTLLGDGMPLGAIILLFEDAPRSSSNYANTVLKCFLAQGLISGQECCYMGEDTQKFIAGLPGPSSRSDSQVAPSKGGEGKEKMSIAWRYKHIQQVESTIGTKKETTLSALDLGKKLDEAISSRCNTDVLETIASRQRIAIRSLGSPLNPLDLSKFAELVKQVRYTDSVMMITFPSYLYNEQVTRRLMHLCDCVLDIQSFVGTAKEADPSFNEYQGFVQILKPLRLPDSFALAVPETANLAFKCKQRRFIIEKFHLPPELGDEPSRNTSSNASCSNVDF